MSGGNGQGDGGSAIRLATTPAPGRPARSGLGVRVRGLDRSFAGRRVLRDLDLTVPAGEFVALLGPSGCGKTTLLRTLAGLDAADRGRVDVAAPLAVVFQEPRLLPWKPVWRNVVWGVERPAATKDRARALLAEVGLETHLDAWPLSLSGGEAQRVAFARALAREPAVLLLDEPFAALDALTRMRMQSLVEQLCQRHHPATVLVTHDVEEALVLADRVVIMAGGRLDQAVTVDLDRPRDRSSQRFNELRGVLLQGIGASTAPA